MTSSTDAAMARELTVVIAIAGLAVATWLVLRAV